MNGLNARCAGKSPPALHMEHLATTHTMHNRYGNNSLSRIMRTDERLEQAQCSQNYYIVNSHSLSSYAAAELALFLSSNLQA